MGGQGAGNDVIAVRTTSRARRLVPAVMVTGLVVVTSAQSLSRRQFEMLERAVTSFAAGRVTESLVDFDELARSAPDYAPQLWQRGIALYYAGRYGDCRAQFESHRLVNPADVENTAWHFLCVARAESPAAARKALLPVGPDARVPMREIYQMFQGGLRPDAVLAAAGRATQATFYAHLYVGLRAEAVGDSAGAREHIAAAADERFADAGGYMHMVARVHLALMQTARR
jgi:lipoprotein NlpI